MELVLVFFFLVAAGLRCGIWALSCSMWNLAPRPGIEPSLPELRVQSLNHGTTREVPVLAF